MRLPKLSFVLVLSLLVGCAVGPKVGPLHDETLIYPLAFDLTYLRTLEALQRVPGWELESTEKEKGLIRVRNINFSGLDDADKRNATFQLKRVDRKETSIQLIPQSQRVVGVGELLSEISKTLNKESR